MAVSASGDAIVVWDEDADANASYNIGLVRLARTNGAVNLTRRTANATPTGQQTQRRSRRTSPATSRSPGSPTTPVRRAPGRASFTPTGTARHDEVQVATGGDAPRSASTTRPPRWSAGPPGHRLDVWVRGFNPDGTDAGRLSAQPLSQSPAGRQEQIAVAVSPWSEVAVAYTDDNDGNTFDQVILGHSFANNGW